MCGIAAQLGDDTGARVARAIDMMSYRGLPERYFVVEAKGGSVGHVRLPIVGTGTEYDQPVRIGPWTIAFVGQVLDFRETDPGMECDLDLVVSTFLGGGMLKDRDGFWSVVAVNSRTGHMVLFCDYLAQKPTYYREDARACASELDACASFGPTTLDEVYLAACIKWGYCPDPYRTPYQEIHRLLPGECVRMDDHGRVDRQIVDRLVPRQATLPEIAAEIEAAVRRRVVSADVPVACLLSGGLDSSLVYALASRYGDVTPYHVRMPGVDEMDKALLVSREYGRGATIQIINDPLVDQEKALSIMQEPIDLGSLLPQIALSRAVQEQVCLTGDGADETFGGYGRAMRYDSQMSDIFQELVCWHLPRLDRVMMRQTIETRSPFLARRVVEMAMGLPWGTRTNKQVLKQISFGILPNEIVEQPKTPLRTHEVEFDREENSRRLVELFRKAHVR